MKIMNDIILILVGGLITAGGVILANSINQQNSKKLKSQEVIREKLEEAYLLIAQDLSEWAHDEMTDPISNNKEDRNSKNPIAKIVMLILCYGPELSEKVKILETVVDQFRKNLFTFYGEILKTGKRPSTQRYAELMKPHDSITSVSKELLLLLTERINETIK